MTKTNKTKRERKDREINRSDKYQFLILEAVCSNDMMEAFSNNDSISHRLNPFSYDEALIDLEDQLKKEFWRVVDESLTTRQKAVLKLFAEGKTQMEIAKILNVNQSSITKNINGNTDYGKGGKRVYGGSLKKIKKIIETDLKINEILEKIKELREERW